MKICHVAFLLGKANYTTLKLYSFTNAKEDYSPFIQQKTMAHPYYICIYVIYIDIHIRMYVCVCIYVCIYYIYIYIQKGIPGGSVVKNPPANAEDTGDAGDTGSIPGSERCCGESNGYPL